MLYPQNGDRIVTIDYDVISPYVYSGVSNSTLIGVLKGGAGIGL